MPRTYTFLSWDSEYSQLEDLPPPKNARYMNQSLVYSASELDSRYSLDEAHDFAPMPGASENRVSILQKLSQKISSITTGLGETTKPLILSIESMCSLDHQIGMEAIEKQYTMMERIIVYLLQDPHLNMQHGFAVDSSEVFLVESSQEIPVYFRPERDHQVHTIHDYDQLINRFSYQLIRALTGKISSKSKANDIKSNRLKRGAIHGYSGWEKGSCESLIFPINDLTHILELKYFIRNHQSQTRMVLRLSPLIAPIDLQHCQSQLNLCDQLQEVIFILTDHQYKDAAKREALIDVFVHLVKTQGWQFFPQVFVLTRRNIVLDYVYELKTEPKEVAGFRSLQANIGFYLSDPRVFAAVSRNIQKASQVHAVRVNEAFISEQADIEQKKSDYIICTGKKSKNYRYDKDLNAEQLRKKAQRCLNLTYQYVLTLENTQQQMQQQQLNHMQQLTQLQQVNSETKTDFGIKISRDCLNMSEFSEALKTHAQKITHLHDSEQLLDRNYYFTDHYITSDPMRRLAKDGHFREKVCATIFARFPRNPYSMGLRNGSFMQIDSDVAQLLNDNILWLLDGLDPEQLLLEEGYYSRMGLPLYRYRTLVGFKYQYNQVRYQYSQSELLTNKRSRQHRDYLALHASGDMQSVIQVDTLLRTKDLHDLSEDEQEQWARILANLLDIFAPDCPNKFENADRVRSELRALMAYHCPQMDLSLWEHLLDSLPELNRDYSRVLLWLIVDGYQHKIQQLLLLLPLLEQRGLLDFFGKIYIRYAITIDSLSDLLHVSHVAITKEIGGVEPKSDDGQVKHQDSHALFIHLLHKIPKGTNHLTWPPFEKFLAHFLLYTSRLGLGIRHLYLNDLKEFWLSLENKIILYHQRNFSKAYQSIEHMLKHLVCAERGLVLAPVGLADTVLHGLEQMIDNGILHRSLEEQTQEWQNLPLARTDAIAAAIEGGFHVISSEMMTDITHFCLMKQSSIAVLAQMDACISSYRVSADDLRKMMHEYSSINMPYDAFIGQIFRYLGGHSLREPIRFYRQLLLERKKLSTPEHLYIYQKLFGYYVMNRTGEHYTRRIDFLHFYDEFLAYLAQSHHAFNDNNALSAMNILSSGIWGVSMSGFEFISKYGEHIDDCFVVFSTCLREMQPEAGADYPWSLWFFYQKGIAQPNYRADQGIGYITQSLTWLGIPINSAQDPSFETLPPVFKIQFPVRDAAKFLSTHSVDLIQSSIIFSQYPHILTQLMIAQIHACFEAACINRGVEAGHSQSKKRDIYIWLKTVYPSQSIEKLISTIGIVESILTDFSEMSLKDDYTIWRVSFLDQLYSLKHVDSARVFFDAMIQTRESKEYQPQHLESLLRHLRQFPGLLTNAAQTRHTLPILFSTYMSHPNSIYSTRIWKMAENLNSLENEDAANTLKLLLTTIPWRLNEASPDLFFLYNPMSAQQLHDIGWLIGEGWELRILAQIFRGNPKINMLEACLAHHDLDLQHRRVLCNLVCYVSENSPTSCDVLTLMQQGLHHSKSVLVFLDRLLRLYSIEAPDVQNLLYNPHLKDEIKKLEQELYIQNVQPMFTDIHEVTEAIAQIRRKAMKEGEADLPLSIQEQNQLKNDYVDMMSYVDQKPVMHVVDHEAKHTLLTIEQLDQDRCQLLYRYLSTQLQDPKSTPHQKRTARLVLIALACKALSTTLKMPPKYTQLLCILHGSGKLKEIKTGGGKSLITVVDALLECASGGTADIVTENIGLAQVGLETFRCFYEYLGVPFAQEVIVPRPKSTRSDYRDQGINYSTYTHMTFYKVLMMLKKKQFPQSALFGDEFDAAVTTSLRLRLACLMDPIYADRQAWDIVFGELLKFVQEKELFLDNTCDADVDVHNFEVYVSRNLANQHVNVFIKKISEDLKVLLNSARHPEFLCAGIDYLPIIRKGESQQYGAPIINQNTKRPEDTVSYGNGTQQLLHKNHNEHLSAKEEPFLLDPMTQTIMLLGTKTLFNFYRSHTGYSGTFGLNDFYREYGRIAYHYAAFHPDRCINLGVKIVATRADHFAVILTHIRQQRSVCPDQPVLVFLDNPSVVMEFQHYLTVEASELNVNIYKGYEETGISEADVVTQSGQTNPPHILLTTLSLTRGTDFYTVCPQGYFGINAAADITLEEGIQILGRIARNGAEGLFIQIICALDLALVTAEIVDPALRFQAHQRIITLNRQAENFRTKYLEDMNYFIVFERLLKLRLEADRLLEEQLGTKITLIAEKDLLKALSSFYKKSEDCYMTLLEEQPALTDSQQIIFKQQLVVIYQQILVTLIPDKKLEKFHAIEPLVALSGLQQAPISHDAPLRDLRAISDVFSAGWRSVGHRTMVDSWRIGDDILSDFQPYFSKECSFKVAMAVLLERQEIFHIPAVIAEIDKIQILVSQINCQETLDQISNDFSENRGEASIEEIGRFIQMIFGNSFITSAKKYVNNYLEECKIKIQERRWDDLSLPDLHIEWIQAWMSAVQNAWCLFSWILWSTALVTGPIPFVVNRFVVPVLLDLLKKLVKHWFANSKSLMMQILIGLDDVCDQLSILLTVLFSKDLERLSIGEFLDKILPIFRNKAVQLIVSKLLGQPESCESFFKLLPELVSALEAHREKPCSELQNSAIVMPLVLTLLQSDFCKQTMATDDHDLMLTHIKALPGNSFEIFHECTLPQLVSVLKALAHPQLNQCLAKLPPAAAFKDLLQWLDAEADTLATPVKTPILELRHYQENTERIAMVANQTFRNIKHKYPVRNEDLDSYQASLRCYSDVIPQSEEPAEERPQTTAAWTWAFYASWVNYMILSSLILWVNYMFFSVSMLFITVSAVVLYSPALYSLLTRSKKIECEETNNDFKPLLIPHQSTTLEERTDISVAPASCCSLPSQSAVSHHLFSFFSNQLNVKLCDMAPRMPSLPSCLQALIC